MSNDNSAERYLSNGISNARRSLQQCATALKNAQTHHDNVLEHVRALEKAYAVQKRYGKSST